jgi:hypothetical protein
MKVFGFILIVGFTILILYNFDGLNVQITDPYYSYMHNNVIILIYKIAIILDGLSIILVIYILQNQNSFAKFKYKFTRIVLFVIAILIIIIMYFELFYGSTFYYGEVRDKQTLPILINNFGFFGGTIILFCELAFIFKFYKRFKNSKRILFSVLVLSIIVLLFFGSYLLLREPWKM